MIRKKAAQKRLHFDQEIQTVWILCIHPDLTYPFISSKPTLNGLHLHIRAWLILIFSGTVTLAFWYWTYHKIRRLYTCTQIAPWMCLYGSYQYIWYWIKAFMRFSSSLTDPEMFKLVIRLFCACTRLIWSLSHFIFLHVHVCANISR